MMMPRLKGHRGKKTPYIFAVLLGILLSLRISAAADTNPPPPTGAVLQDALKLVREAYREDLATKQQLLKRAAATN